MAKTFDPAPVDEHADDPRKATRADKERSKLEKGLEETFPASDTVSETQPKKAG